MAEKKETRGRPQSNLNWEEIDQLLVSGCSGAEVAAYCGVNPATIYERCKTDHGKLFHEYSREKKAKGESLLRAHQFSKALGKTDKGDNTLLVWLGKQRLDQRDKPKDEDSSKNLVELLKLLKQEGILDNLES